MNVLDIIRVAETHPPAEPPSDLPEAPEYVDREDREVTSGARDHKPWRIDTADTAEWALRRKAEHDQEIARVKAQAEAAKAWIDRRAAQLVREAERGSNFFEAVLLEWALRARAEIVRGKAKSRKFLFGVIGFKSSREKLVYDDEEKALEWAKRQGVEAGLYRITYALEKDAVKAWCRKHGTVPDGAHWDGGQEIPYVEAEAPALPGTLSTMSLESGEVKP